MKDLKNMVLDALQEQNFDLISAMEYWNKFMDEIKNLPGGKHSYLIGEREITFTIKR